MNPYQVHETNDASTLISADVLSPGRFKSFFLSFTFSDLKLKENDAYFKRFWVRCTNGDPEGRMFLSCTPDICDFTLGYKILSNPCYFTQAIT